MIELTLLIAILIFVFLLSSVAYIVYKYITREEMSLVDDGVDELGELDNAYDNLLEAMYQRGIISDDEKRELKKWIME